MDAPRILSKLRRDLPLDREEIEWFAKGLATGEVGDAQAGAFAMGVCKTGMSEAERVALTAAMRDSGEILSWDLNGPIVDKHSTGGIGDCVSLVLAPALAAAGAYVPMISGRGLGHTGGTLDKMEAIPGLSTEVAVDRFQDIVARLGTAIVAASDRTAPADRRLYAVRDVTSTVESIDLITASILSKKLAAGLGSLILDVKVGSGAFMKSMEEAEALANSLVDTANGAGCATAALITDMNQPLVPSAGNSVEVAEVMEVLVGAKTGNDLWQLTCDLGGAVLHLAGLASDAKSGASAIADAIGSGAAAEIFGTMVAEMGGPADFTENWRTQLPVAAVQQEVIAEQTGRITEIDGQALGLAVVGLGGGRLTAGARIDYAVGLTGILRLGAEVASGQALCVVHAADEGTCEAAKRAVRGAFVIGEGEFKVPSLLKARVG